MDDINLLLLRDRAHIMKISLDETQLDAFQRYYRLLLEWNDKFNLTTITEPDEVVEKHFLDSLSISLIMEPLFDELTKQKKPLKMIDIGAGAGFPGIPLKILYGKRIRLMLVDSVAKKVGFIKEVIAAMGLEGCDAIHGRAEDLGQLAEYRERYHLVTARALAAMPVLLEYTLPFLQQNGRLIAMKASKEGAEREVKEAGTALSVLGGSAEAVRELVLPMSDLNRSAVVVRKVRATPSKYHRKAGTASKSPLS